MKNKKLMALLLCVCMAFVLTACHEKNISHSLPDDSDPSSAVAQQERTKEQASPEEYQYEAQELNCKIGEQSIYGIAYLPKVQERVPLVIFAHELGSTHRSGIPYAERLASHGIAVYLFDFRGGSAGSRSDGATTEMSVMTEADDVQAVISAAQGWDFADPNRIVLIGASQGGMASAVAASRDPESISGLVLLYPALLVRDAVQEEFGSLERVPEQYNFNGWIMVGKNYAADVWDYDVYEEMKDFPKPVLILHGDRDSIVDVSYSTHAAERYPDAELHILEDAGHGFSGGSFDEAIGYLLNYLRKVEILPQGGA